jgi:hypothetical protein
MKLQANYVPRNDYQRTFAIRPKVTLSGKWMEEAGFLPSTLINIEVQFGKLVITTKE